MSEMPGLLYRRQTTKSVSARAYAGRQCRQIERCRVGNVDKVADTLANADKRPPRRRGRKPVFSRRTLPTMSTNLVHAAAWRSRRSASISASIRSRALLRASVSRAAWAANIVCTAGLTIHAKRGLTGFFGGSGSTHATDTRLAMTAASSSLSSGELNAR